MTQRIQYDPAYLADLLRQGHTAGQIASLFHVTRMTVNNHVKKYHPELLPQLKANGQKRHGKGLNTRVEPEACVRYFRDGRTKADIAGEFGVCPQAVHNCLIRRGVIAPAGRRA